MEEYFYVFLGLLFVWMVDICLNPREDVNSVSNKLLLKNDG
jgi:hypothetical protein